MYKDFRKLKEFVRSVPFCWVFHYVHFRYFRNLKMRFLDIDSFGLIKYYNIRFRYLEVYIRVVMCNIYIVTCPSMIRAN